MPNCCSNSSATQVCPQCGAACKSVEMRTLYHQVRFPENQGIILGRYYFCSSKDCVIGYFSIAGARIPKQHLRTCQEIREDGFVIVSILMRTAIYQRYAFIRLTRSKILLYREQNQANAPANSETHQDNAV